MTHRAITALARSLQPRVRLGKSGLETILLIVGMVSARTVNLGHIACGPGACSSLDLPAGCNASSRPALPRDWAV